MKLKLRMFMISIALVATLVVPVVRAADKKEEVEIPKPKNMTLVTRDGVQLRCTWYAGTLGKKSVPVILLHGWEGVRGEYSELAKTLQERGHAVMVPDLRGHGESTQVMIDGDLEDIDVKKLGKDLILGMSNDIKAVKKFLLEKNNDGELNIELLCVVAADISCIVAMNWAVQDWNLPQLRNDVKQGKDVKALVLLSPKQSFMGVRSATAEKNPLFTGSFRGRPSPFTLSVMIISPDQERNRKSWAEANKLHTTLGRTRKELDPDLSRSEVLRQKDLYFIDRDVKLEGTALLDETVKPSVDKQIYGFIHYRLEQQADLFAWTNRSRNQTSED